MTGTTRRHMLGALGFTGLAGTATAAIAAPDAADVSTPQAPHPDAELIALCGQVVSVTASIGALLDALPADISPAAEDAFLLEHIHPLEREQMEMLARSAEIRATTLKGHRARAAALFRAEIWDVSNDHIGALIRDLVNEQADG